MGSNCCSAAIGNYKTYDELINALQKCGVLEDLEIMVGIDATKSNEMSGALSFAGRSLHDLTYTRDNPYMAVMKVAIKFFQRDLDSNIPLSYFGSVQANQLGGVQTVKVCRGIDDLVNTYRASIPYQTLSGPTTFIPLIREAVERCKSTKKYHILLIVTDGAVQDEEKHYKALTEASHYPLSIVCVGVGDGPWDMMNRFDDRMPKGKVFDNFQFVSFPDIAKKEATVAMQEEFFFQAFMEVPMQYEFIKKKLGYEPPPEPGPAMPGAAPPPPAAMYGNAYDSKVMTVGPAAAGHDGRQGEFAPGYDRYGAQP